MCNDVSAKYDSLLDAEFEALKKEIETKTGIKGVWLNLDFNWARNEPSVIVYIVTTKEIPVETRQIIESLSKLELQTNRNNTHWDRIDRYGNIGNGAKRIIEWKTIYKWTTGKEIIESKVDKMSSVDYNTHLAIIEVPIDSDDISENFNLFVNHSTKLRQVVVGNKWSEFWNIVKFVKSVSKSENPNFMIDTVNRNYQRKIKN